MWKNKEKAVYKVLRNLVSFVFFSKSPKLSSYNPHVIKIKNINSGLTRSFGGVCTYPHP